MTLTVGKTNRFKKPAVVYRIDPDFVKEKSDIKKIRNCATRVKGLHQNK